MTVVDTCVVIWLAADPSELSVTATEAIRAARKSGGVAISCMTLFELAWLIERKHIAVAMSAEAFLAMIEARFHVLPLTAAVSRLAAGLPEEYPSDPFDRLIGATALDRGVALITRDKGIRRSKAVPVLW